jgi:hypothetical protein
VNATPGGRALDSAPPLHPAAPARHRVRADSSVLIKATALATVAFMFAACGDDDSTTRSHAPVVNSFGVGGNANNVLAAIAMVDVTGADSARVFYWTGSDAKQSTPYVADLSSGRLVVLGLRPETAYNFYLEGYGGGVTAQSDTATFTTGALPAFLASASLTSATPASGGYVLAPLFNGSSAFAVAFDSAGRVAWYREFPGGIPGEEIKQQENGDITLGLSITHGADLVPGQAVEIAPDGSIVRTFTAPESSYFDPHEFWLLFRDGAYDGALLLAYTARHLDLSAQGGPGDSLVVGHQIVRQDASGAQHVLFDAWDHFQLSNNVEPVPLQEDFDHPNSISIAPDGNYVVSWRNLDAITKIDATTGALIWTLASSFSTLTSDFTITGDPLNGFSAQHSARVLANGNLLVFDNGTRHATPASRAVEYSLDESTHQATMVFQYAHSPSFLTRFTGSVQRLQSGNTLIGWTFGNPLVATEVTPQGSTVWEGTLHADGTQVPYRFTKIRSLYRYEQP